MHYSSSVASVGSTASRCRAGPHERVGVTAKRQKECAFSTTEDHLPWRGMGLHIDAGTPVTGMYRVHPVSCGKNKARPVTHCQTASETVRSYGSSIQRDIFWTAVHETSTVVTQDQRVFPEGQPLSHDQGHAAMISRLGNVEETLVPVPGSHAGSFMSSQDASDRCLSHGLGSNPRGTLESSSVEGPASLMAHQPSGDVGCISCSQEFPSRSQGPPCACPLRQHIGGVLHKSPGGFAVTSTLQTGMPNPPVLPREVVVSSSSLYPWGRRYRSRHPAETGAEARGIEAPPQGGGADMEALVDMFASRETSHCPLWFSLTHPAPLGPDVMVQTWPRLFLYAFSPIVLLPGVLERVCRDRVLLLLIAPWWPGRVWFPDLISLLDRPPMELPVRMDLLSQAGSSIFHPNQNCGNYGLGL